jgi:phytoene dehydrogenase-like protein
LVAAIELEKAGYYPVILEAGDKIGGRIQTEEIEGFKLDQGFQVLLTAYPEAQHYLDFEALSLKIFQPGAVIFKPGDIFSVYDPLRKPLKMIPMVFSKVGTVLDKVRMYQLTKALSVKRDEDIFSSTDMTTLEYLKKKGFSGKIIKNFFEPFFKGIFLEEELKTSSRMFEFIFKMFAIGNASIPEKGMQEIPRQLFSKLHNTKIQYNTHVDQLRTQGFIWIPGT